MKVIAFIEQEDAIYRILSHLGLLGAGDVSRAPPPSSERSPSAGSAGWTYEPLFDDLAFDDPAS